MASLPPSHFYLQNPNPGQFRHPFNMQYSPYQPGTHSLQNMTSHWNLPPPAPPVHSHAPSVMSSAGVKNNNKNQAQNRGSAGSLKPPKAPEKPLLPYMRYSRKMWEEFKKTEGSDLKVWEVGKIIGQKWRELGEKEKQPYFDEYEQEKAVYDDLVKQYHNSTAYKQYLEAKKMAERHGQSAGVHGMTSTVPMESTSPVPPPIIVPPRHSSSDPRLLMLQQQQQQQEEDDEDEYLSSKQLAAARFHRNHRLMGEIFSDYIVPDIKSAQSNLRYETLKEQSKSLQEPLKKLQDEVAMLENKYLNKRAAFLDDAERFKMELRKIQENPPTTWKKPQLLLSPKDIPEPTKSAKFFKL